MRHQCPETRRPRCGSVSRVAKRRSLADETSRALSLDPTGRRSVIALAVGQALACLVVVFGVKGETRMPLPLADIGLTAAAALACWLALDAIELTTLARMPSGIALKLAVCCLAAGATAWTLNIVGLADGVTRWRRRAL